MVILSTLAALLLAAAAQQPEPIYFGKVPSLNPQEMVATHEPLMRYLSRRLGGREVRFALAPDYDTMAQFLKERRVDAAWLGPLNYPKACDAGACELLVRVKRPRGVAYRGIIIARADKKFRRLAALKGRSFAFTEPRSASGYFYPRLTLLGAGINPDQDLKAACLKSHDQVVAAVLAGRFDAGAVYEDARELIADPEQRKSLVVLARTSLIPNEPIVVRKGLDAKLVSELKAALLALDPAKPEYKDILDQTQDVSGFVPGTESDYDPVRADVRLYEEAFGADPAAACAESARKSPK